MPEKLFMDRTGHRDVKSLHAYQRETGREREVVYNTRHRDQEFISRGITPKNVKS